MKSEGLFATVTDDVYAVSKNLRSLAEDIKLPIVRMLSHIQAVKITDQDIDPDYLEITARMSIRLIDSYIASVQIYSGQRSLNLQPVSVVAAMCDANRYLSKFAKINNCDLVIESAKKTKMAMGNKDALVAAFVGMGYSLISSSNNVSNKLGSKSTIIFKTNSVGGKVGVAAYMNGFNLTNKQLSSAIENNGSYKHATKSIQPGSVAGIVIADNIFRSLSERLKIKKNKSMGGLYSELLPSYQIAMF